MWDRAIGWAWLPGRARPAEQAPESRRERQRAVVVAAPDADDVDAGLDGLSSDKKSDMWHAYVMGAALGHEATLHHDRTPTCVTPRQRPSACVPQGLSSAMMGASACLQPPGTS